MISLRTAELYILSLHTYQPCPQDYSLIINLAHKNIGTNIGTDWVDIIYDA